MTEQLKKSIIALVASALNGEKGSLSKDVDLEALYQFSLRQNLTPLVYYSLVQSGFSKDHPMMLKFFSTTCQFIALAEQQDAQMERNFLAFEEKGIGNVSSFNNKCKKRTAYLWHKTWVILNISLNSILVKVLC